eukprot:Phypoly_transcript_09456.p1 GENE.Phypoly_transcript_09456~~Phypoly_transcript_09456.p1  ORF type:complete len:369 (-),score=64.52 Phypoly_transcript_09456:211-1317(-)
MGNTHASYGHTATPSPRATTQPHASGDLPPSVQVVKNPLGASIYLVGVNHVDQRSCEDVKQTIQKVQPDTVFLEISGERFSTLTYNGPLKIQPLTIFNGATGFAQSLMARIAFYQAAILDTRPGAELRTALEEGKKSTANIILGDRVGDITWQRIMCTVTLPDIVRAIPTCVRYARDLARLPTKDAMKQYLIETMDESSSDPAKFLVPSAYPVMVTEKDLYIASVLRECPGERVVAVVGRGHVEGIKQHLHDKDDAYLLRAELSRTTRFSQSPLARQSLAAAAALTAVTGGVAAMMARALNRTRTTRKFRGTIPITLLLLTLEAGAGWMWLANEWLKFHTAVTQAVVAYRDQEEAKRVMDGNINTGRK